MKKQQNKLQLRKATLSHLQQAAAFRINGGAVVKNPTTTCTRQLPGSGCCCSMEGSGCAGQSVAAL